MDRSSPWYSSLLPADYPRAGWDVSMHTDRRRLASGSWPCPIRVASSLYISADLDWKSHPSDQRYFPSFRAAKSTKRIIPLVHVIQPASREWDPGRLDMHPYLCLAKQPVHRSRQDHQISSAEKLRSTPIRMTF